MDNTFNDLVLQCGNHEAHEPHIWFERESWPDGYRCFGVLPAEATADTWPPKIEHKGIEESCGGIGDE